MSMVTSIAPAHFGLEIGAVPVRAIRPRTGRRTMPGWFATRKGVNGSIRTESLLEMAGLSQYEVNPDCVLMAGQPHHLHYWVPVPGGGTVKAIYTPDVAILMRSGAIAVVDFKPAKYARHPRWLAKKALLKAAYQRDHGITFSTVTDEEIGIEPRRTNVAVMLSHRSIVNVRDDEARVALATAILQLGLPTTIGAITSRVRLPSPHADVNRAFSGLMEMAIEGGIALDLGRPIGPDTEVRPRDDRSEPDHAA